jgi:hypothetical protein
VYQHYQDYKYTVYQIYQTTRHTPGQLGQDIGISIYKAHCPYEPLSKLNQHKRIHHEHHMAHHHQQSIDQLLLQLLAAAGFFSFRCEEGGADCRAAATAAFRKGLGKGTTAD